MKVQAESLGDLSKAIDKKAGEMAQAEHGERSSAASEADQEMRKQFASEQELARKLRTQKVLVAILGKNLAESINKKKIAELRGQSLAEILKVLNKKEDQGAISAKDYTVLLEQLKAPTIDVLKERLKDRTDKRKQVITVEDIETMRSGEKSDSEVLVGIEKQVSAGDRQKTLEQVLAQESRSKLETRLLDSEKRLAKARAQIAQKESLGEDITHLDAVELVALEVETVKVRQAMTERDLDNYQIFQAIEQLNLIVEDSAIPSEQVLELREIDALRDEIQLDLSENANRDMSVADLEVQLKKLEKLRTKVKDFSKEQQEKMSQFEEEFEETQITESESIAEKTGAAAHRELQELVDSFPKSKVRLLREKAGRGDLDALDEFLNSVSAQEYSQILSEVVLAEPTDSSSKSRVENLLEAYRGQGANMLEADKIELYTLLGTTNTLFDAREIQSRIANPAEAERGLARVKVEVDEEGGVKAREANEDLSAVDNKITELLAEIDKARTPTETEKASYEVYKNAQDILRLDFEHLNTYAEVSERVQQARIDLVKDILARWKTKLTGEEERFGMRTNRQELLTPDMIRFRFNLYELTQFDLDDDLDQQEVQKRAYQTLKEINPQAEVGTEDMQKIILEIAKLGPLALHKWAEAKNPANFEEWVPTYVLESTKIVEGKTELARLQEALGQLPELADNDTRRQIRDAIELAMLTPAEKTVNAHGETSYVAHKNALELYKSSLNFRKVDMSVEQFIAENSSEEELAESEDENEERKISKLERFALTNLLYNRLLTKIKLLDSPTLTPEKKKAIITAINARKPQFSNFSQSLNSEVEIIEACEEIVRSVLIEFDALEEKDVDSIFSLAVPETDSSEVAPGSTVKYTEVKLTQYFKEHNLRANELFSIEKVPAGIAVRFHQRGAMRDLLGLEHEYGTGVKGVNLLKDNILGFGEREFSGGIVVIDDAVDSNTDYHEIAHIMDEHLLNMLPLGEGNESNHDTSFYGDGGIAEVVAQIVTPVPEGEGFENISDEMIGGRDYTPKLADINIIPSEEALDLNDAELRAYVTGDESGLAGQEDLVQKLKENKKSFVVQTLVHQILRHYAEQGTSTVELDEIKAVLLNQMYSLGNNPDQLAYSLVMSFPDVDLGIDMEILRADILKARDEGADKTISDIIFSHFAEQRLAEGKQALNIFTGDEIPAEENIPGELDQFRTIMTRLLQMNDSYQFAMAFPGATGRVSQPPKQFGATSPDSLDWGKQFSSYHEGKGLGQDYSELKTRYKWHEFLNRKESRSYFEETAPYEWSKLPIVKFPINAITNFAVRRFTPMNTRDLQSAFAGTWLGRTLGMSEYKSSSPSMMARYIGTQHAEQALKEYLPGFNEKHSYAGHQYPDFIKDLDANNRHMEVIKSIQNNIGARLSGGETQSFLESIPTIQLEIIPGDRPNFNPAIADAKADRISHLEFVRMQREIFNFNTPFGKRLAYDNYEEPLEFKMGGVNYDVITDENGNLVMINKKTKEKKLFTEANLVDEHGAGTLRGKEGPAFYKNWRPEEVRYKDKNYFVHYNPHTGQPGLYEEENIDWSRWVKTAGKWPEPVKEDGKIVPPRFTQTMRKPGVFRRHLDLNAASNGVFSQIMKVREEQIAAGATEAQLYSLRDLIRSIRNYEDHFAGPADPPFVDEVKINGRKMKQIFIPDPSGSGNHIPVDYEAAQELVTRIEKFYVQDKIVRQAWVKNLAPEQGIFREQEIPLHPKVRETVRNYLVMIADEDLAYLNLSPTDPTYAANYEYTRAGITETLKKYDSMTDAQRAALNDTQKEEYQRAQNILNKSGELDEYEQILFYGNRSLFKNHSAEDRVRLKTQLGGMIRNTLLANGIDIDTMVEAEITAHHSTATAAEKEVLRSKYRRQLLDNVLEDHFADARGGTGGVEATFTGWLITKLMIEDKLNITSFNPGTRGTTITAVVDHTGTPLAGVTPDNLFDVAKETNGIRNLEYDRRTVTRFMDRFDLPERERASQDIMVGIKDGLKYRQEMKGYTVATMELSNHLYQEFNRYRDTKHHWEGVSRWIRRLNHVMIFGSLAAMFLVPGGSVLAFYMLILFGGLSAKFITPYLDVRTSIAVNRRNYARELSRKYRSEALRVKERFEKGETLDDNARIDLEELILEMNIMGESIQGKKTAEGFAPTGHVGWDQLLDLTIGPNGELVKALSS